MYVCVCVGGGGVELKTEMTRDYSIDNSVSKRNLPKCPIGFFILLYSMHK